MRKTTQELLGVVQCKRQLEDTHTKYVGTVSNETLATILREECQEVFEAWDLPGDSDTFLCRQFPGLMSIMEVG